MTPYFPFGGHSRAGGNPGDKRTLRSRQTLKCERLHGMLCLLDFRLRGITSHLPARGLSGMASCFTNDGTKEC